VYAFRRKESESTWGSESRIMKTEILCKTDSGVLKRYGTQRDRSSLSVSVCGGIVFRREKKSRSLQKGEGIGSKKMVEKNPHRLLWNNFCKWEKRNRISKGPLKLGSAKQSPFLSPALAKVRKKTGFNVGGGTPLERKEERPTGFRYGDSCHCGANHPSRSTGRGRAERLGEAG